MKGVIPLFLYKKFAIFRKVWYNKDIKKPTRPSGYLVDQPDIGGLII